MAIRVTNAVPVDIAEDGKTLNTISGYCNSSDEKPTSVGNGSVLIETDTGDMYIFDEDAESWGKFGSIGTIESSESSGGV